jgi:hypothetical protein
LLHLADLISCHHAVGKSVSSRREAEVATPLLVGGVRGCCLLFWRRTATRQVRQESQGEEMDGFPGSSIGSICNYFPIRRAVILTDEGPAHDLGKAAHQQRV